jgi:DNA-binding PadR family transcriptional regulator
MVLALLREDDMHPYEMIRLLRHRRDDRTIPVTNGTLYHTVGRLQRAGLLTEVGVDRDGNRPERTTYTLTSEGREAVVSWVRHELVRIGHPAEFRVALAEAHNLAREDALALLAERRDALAREYDETRAGLATARETGVPEQYLIEVDRQAVLLAADLAWTERVIIRLSEPGYAWGKDPDGAVSDRYLAQRKAARS